MKIVAGFLLAVMLEGVYAFYEWKGRAPIGPVGIYRMLPAPIQSGFRGMGRFWARVAERRKPLTLLPDHVTVCLPPAVNDEHANSERANKEVPQWVQALEMDAASMMRAVARRWAKPGMTYDENLDKDLGVGGAWIGYVEQEQVDAYRRGERLAVPVSVQEYHAHGRTLRCGNTSGHEEGPGYWNEYAVTFEGKFILVD